MGRWYCQDINPKSDLEYSRFGIAFLFSLAIFFSDGCATDQITNAPPQIVHGNPQAISHDSTECIYFLSGATGTQQLYAMRPDGSGEVEITTDSTRPILAASISKDESRMLLEVFEDSVAGDSRYALYQLDISSLALTKLMIGPNRIGGYSAFMYNPIFSPDNNHIAFARRADLGLIGISNIFVTAPGQAIPQQITNNFLLNNVFDWGSDGLSLLATTTKSNLSDSTAPLRGYTVIAQMTLDGSISKSWEHKGYDWWAPSYSRSQHFIAFVSDDHPGPYQDISVLDTKTRAVWALSNDHSRFLHFEPSCWSPDDTHILCVGVGNGFPARIITINAESGDTKDISPPSGTPLRQYTPIAWARTWPGKISRGRR